MDFLNSQWRKQDPLGLGFRYIAAKPEYPRNNVCNIGNARIL